MRQLRSMTTWVAALSILFAFGCDNTPAEVDSGTVRLDAGPTGTDAGPTDTDAGPPMGVDAGPIDGGGAGMCTGPTTGDCDLTDPTSCGAGMACVPIGMSTTSWMTQCIMAGVGGQGATCDPSMQGQCQEGFVCSSSRNICQKICCATSDCDTGDFCGNVGGLNAGFCATPVDCDPIAQTGCEDSPGTGCYPADGGLDCVGAGTLGEGEVCVFANDCMPGMGCLGPMGGPSNCRQWCDMTAADPCPAGFTCGGITGLPVGACLPM